MTTALESQSLTAAGVYDLLFAAPSKAAAEPPPVNTPQPPPGKARQTRPKKPSLDDESAVSGLSR